MDALEQEILERFEQSRNAYNKAAGLLKKGQGAEAEELLKQALAAYPREIFMNEDVEIDKSIMDSFDLLFSNIRDRLERIERDRELQPRLDPNSIKSLQDLIESNQGQSPSEPLRRPGMKTQAAAMPGVSGLPIPPKETPSRAETSETVLDLDAGMGQGDDELTHDQIMRELEAAASESHAFKAPPQGDPEVLEEGEVDELEIRLDGEQEPAAPEPEEDWDTAARIESELVLDEEPAQDGAEPEPVAEEPAMGDPEAEE